MVIDNTKIQEYIEAIQIEEAKLQATINTIATCKIAFEAIQITKIEKPNNKGGYDMVDKDIMDKPLNEKMSDVRRQAIYDKIVKIWTDHKTDSKV